MPFARNLTPAVGTGVDRPDEDHSRLLFLAVSLSVLFALAAFLFFVLRDRSQVNVMVNYQQQKAVPAPVAASAGIAPAVISAPTPALPGAALTVDPKGIHGAPEFTLRLSDHTEALGPLQIRLLKTDSKRRTYDIAGTVGGREFTHHEIRLNEPLWIVVSHSAPSIKLVADAITGDTVTGYWTQAGHPAQVSQRKRVRRRLARSGL